MSSVELISFGEEQVPAGQRWLHISGALSMEDLDRVRPGLPRTWPDTVRCLFVHFAYADLPLGKTFDRVCPLRWRARALDLSLAESTVAVIHAVTQQFAKPFGAVPYGWKTICLIDFPRGAPPLVEHLPTVSDWYDGDFPLALYEQSVTPEIAPRSPLAPR